MATKCTLKPGALYCGKLLQSSPEDCQLHGCSGSFCYCPALDDREVPDGRPATRVEVKKSCPRCEQRTPNPECPVCRAPSTAALPTDPVARKGIPLARGLLDYFPAALAAVAELSKIGNDQHNPGQPMHHARGKSTDHADCILRHLVDRGTIDSDNVRHSTKVAWRALANLQLELEEAGAPMARGAKP